MNQKIRKLFLSRQKQLQKTLETFCCRNKKSFTLMRYFIVAPHFINKFSDSWNNFWWLLYHVTARNVFWDKMLKISSKIGRATCVLKSISNYLTVFFQTSITFDRIWIRWRFWARWKDYREWDMILIKNSEKYRKWRSKKKKKKINFLSIYATDMNFTHRELQS